MSVSCAAIPFLSISSTDSFEIELFACACRCPEAKETHQYTCTSCTHGKNSSILFCKVKYFLVRIRIWPQNNFYKKIWLLSSVLDKSKFSYEKHFVQRNFLNRVGCCNKNVHLMEQLHVHAVLRVSPYASPEVTNQLISPMLSDFNS